MIEKKLLRMLVLETLINTPITQINNIIGDVERLVKTRNLFPSQADCERQRIDFYDYQQRQLHKNDTLMISEIVWDLIQERIVTPGNENADNGFPFFRLTKFGQEYISTSPPHFYDPQGYLEFLKKIVPSLDPVIEQYIFESLNCYRQQLFFASAVMIGAAAEKAILLLLQKIHDSMQNQTKKKKMAKLLERPNLPDIYDILITTTEPLIKSNTIPYTVHRGSAVHLVSFFEMIRVQRNDAIHPTNGKVDRIKVFLELQTIPTALECIYGLIDWFKVNPIS